MRLFIKKYTFPIIFLFPVFLFSCSEPGDETETQTVSKDSIPAASNVHFDAFSRGFRKLVKTPEGTFRGVNLGDSVVEVRKLEQKSELEEDAPNHVDYMVDYAELEEAEVRYLFGNKNTIEAIDVNIYPKSKESQDSMFAESNTYFRAKYGDPVSSDSVTSKWENKEQNLFILLQKKGNQKIHDLNIRFAYLSQEITSLLHERIE